MRRLESSFASFASTMAGRCCGSHYHDARASFNPLQSTTFLRASLDALLALVPQPAPPACCCVPLYAGAPPVMQWTLTALPLHCPRHRARRRRRLVARNDGLTMRPKALLPLPYCQRAFPRGLRINLVCRLSSSSCFVALLNSAPGVPTSICGGTSRVSPTFSYRQLHRSATRIIADHGASWSMCACPQRHCPCRNLRRRRFGYTIRDPRKGPYLSAIVVSMPLMRPRRRASFCAPRRGRPRPYTRHLPVF